jgi:hypothetical protein
MPGTLSRRTTATVLALTLGGLVLSSTTAQAANPNQIATSITNGVSYVKSLQGSDGSYVTSGGLSNEWAFSALAAAGVAAADVAPAGNPSANARGVYQNQLAAAGWPSASPVVTDYERGTLNAYAAGIDPARVSAGQNLIADIYSYWQTANPGYFGPPANFNGTVFALLALAGAKTQGGAQRVPQSLLNTGVAAVRANQHTDGGWDFSQAAGNPTALAAASDIDMTGATMAALCASGVPNTDSAVTAAESFLQGQLVSNSGAFNSMYGVNTDSNAWAVSGLNVCGFNPQGPDFTTAQHKTPVDFLIANQFNPGGGFKYQPTDTSPTAYSSIDSLRAVAGGGFTAAPPTPITPGAPQWTAASAFAGGTTSTIALTVDDGSGNLKVCSVAVAPTGSTTTLGAVLDAATSAATPAGCVTGSSPSTPTGQITTVNGVTNSGSSTWQLSDDGAASVTAARDTVVNLGDTLALHYGS